MSRRLAQSFHSHELAELTRQLLFAPPERRIVQVQRAEALYDQIDPQQNYPLDFVAHRITRYKPEAKSPVLLVGEALRPDLQLLIDALSRSIGMPFDPEDPTETTEELAERLQVSTKTIGRWRRLGLRWRWVRPEENQPARIAFTRSAVDRFLAEHRERVGTAGRFTHMTPEMKQQLLQRARRLAAARELSLNQIAGHLAKRTGRSLETIRGLLQQHDQQHPEAPIFVDHAGPVTSQQQRVIARAFRMGVSVEHIAAHYKRTPATVYRSIRRRRAADLHKRQIHFIALPIFERPDADEVLLRAETEPDTTQTPVTSPPTERLPEELRNLFSDTPPDSEQWRRLLVRMNYLLFKANRLRDGLNRYDPRTTELDAIDSLLAQAGCLRSRIARLGLPTLLHVAGQHLTDRSTQSVNRLLNLLESGIQPLAEAIDSYDAAKGQDFPAHLRWMLMRYFAMMSDEQHAHARKNDAPGAALERLLAIGRRAGLDLNRT